MTSDPKPKAVKPKAAPKTTAKKTIAKKTPAKKTKTKIAVADEIEVKDPIGDETDGEAQTADAEELAAEAIEDEIETDAEIEDNLEADESSNPESEDDSDFTPTPRPPAKLERLQKLLAAAGIASRRKAEEMIEQGRVQVNGKTVTALGTKADMGRDHIRVDGKLLQGAERLRYFVLNKPKGFVTTVKDPEGRPTVMQFFDKMKERLYPVGRLDYMSEGLLVVTNDGELANRLTRAAAGVEKTYLVKVAGQPSEAELDILRGGVSIERGKPGEGRVRTAPARIRQVRQGDNPWYEVVLIEGRNRELRKMFESVGHFVEKIRRVGYGPLVLDQEPGNLRELEPVELDALRKTAEGKLKTPKSKDLRRRNLLDSQLPTVAPRATRLRPGKPLVSKSFDEAPAAGPRDYQPKKPFVAGAARPTEDKFRSAGSDRRPASPGFGRYGSSRPTGGRPSARPAWQKSNDRPAPRINGEDSNALRPQGRSFAAKPYGDRPAAGKTFGSKPAGRGYGDKPATERPSRPYGDKPASRPFAARPEAGADGAKPFARPFGDKPERKPWSKPGSGDRSFGKPRPSGKDRPDFKRSAAPQRADDDYSDLEPRKPVKLFIEPIQYDARPSAPRSSAGGRRSDRPAPNRSSAPRSSSRPSTSRPPSDRPYTPRPRTDGFSSDRPSSPSAGRPFRSEGSSERTVARPFTTSSGKPRPGGARPSSKPGKSGGSRPYGAATGAPRGGSRPDSRSGSDSRPGFSQRPPAFRRTEGEGSFAPRGDKKTGWKPKPSFGGKPSSNSRPKPKPGSSAKPSHRSKPGGSAPKRFGSGPGGKKRG